jgi:hypothetical protein
MRVDAPATGNCDTPPRPSDQEVRLAGLLEQLDRRFQASAGSPARQGRGPVLRPTERSDQWPADELAESQKRGEAGDPSSARRTAELLELVEDFSGARTWWHRAAALGDRDAINYVREILNG